MEPPPGATRRAYEAAKRIPHWVGGGSGAAGGLLCVWRAARRVLFPGARERRQQQRVLIRGSARRNLLQRRIDSAQGSRAAKKGRGWVTEAAAAGVVAERGAPGSTRWARSHCLQLRRRGKYLAGFFFLPPKKLFLQVFFSSLQTFPHLQPCPGHLPPGG